MASIDNVVTIDIELGSTAIQADNINVVGIITSDTSVLSTADRYRRYTTLDGVESDFATSTAVYNHAASFFSTKPNPISVGGELVIGHWRAVDESVAAIPAILTGAQISEAETLGKLQSISDGAFDIDVDGVTKNITGLDFRVAATEDDIIDILNDELVGAAATLDDLKIIITSATTGVTSLMTYATTPLTGTDVSVILGLAVDTGSLLTQGVDAGTIVAESKLDAIIEIKAQTNIFGAMFIDKPTDIEIEALASWAGAEQVILYDVFNSAINLEVDITNQVWVNKLSGYTDYRAIYSKSGNRKLATSYMAQMHSVDFTGINTAKTMQNKQLSTLPEDFSQTEIDKAKTVGVDIYTTIKNTPLLLTSGANGFTDDVYGITAYATGLQTVLANVLQTTPTKVAQTEAGGHILVDAASHFTKSFVRANEFGAGAWNDETTIFGDRGTFLRAITQSGYYILLGQFSDQSVADRDARKSPLLQIAVKLAGAIHSISVRVNINR